MAETATISLLERFNPVLLAGPIFDKEFRVASRQRRLYWLRCGYVCLFMLVIFQSYAVVHSQTSTGSSVLQVSRMSQSVRGLVSAIVWFQFIAGQLLAAILLGGSINGEIRQRTFDVLLTTPITSFQIVVGKWASKLLQVVAFLAIGLPMLAIVRVFGGVPWDFVVSGLCITLTASMFVGALALLLSVTSRQTQQVVGNVLGWCIVFWVGSAGLLAALSHFGHMSHSMSHFIGQMTNPFVAMVRATHAMVGSRNAPPWGWHCLATLAGAGVLLGLAIWRVRRVRWASVPFPIDKGGRRPAGPGAATAGRVAAPGRIRPVKGRPIVWKEMRKGLLLRPRRTRWDVVRLVLAGGFILACVGTMLVARFIPPGVVFIGMAYVCLLLFTIGVTSASASAITQEKEARTWPILLTTTLDNGEIVNGKAMGSVARHLPLIGIAAALALLGVLSEPKILETPGGVMLYILLWLVRSIGTVVFLVGLALFFGTRMKTTTVAVVTTFAIYLGARLGWTMIMMPLTLLLGPSFMGASFLILMVFQGIVYGVIGFVVLRVAAVRLRRNVF